MKIKDETYSYKFDFWLTILFVLNILDLIFSCTGLQIGFIEEANPIMAYLYSRSILAFLLCKILLPSFLIIIISRLLKLCENITMISILVYIAICIYGAINVFHLWCVYKMTFQ